MGIVLRCTVGPCAGETITIDTELVLGREESEPGRLGGDSRLSRRHARLLIDDQGRAVVEDLGSTNGTWINEQRLSGAATIENGDVLRVGQTTFDCEIPVLAVATRVDTVAPAVVPTVAEAPAAQPQLLVVTGPKEGDEIPLENEFLVGRSFGEPGALGGDRRLSRRHARIARGPGGSFFVEDLGSSNGTTLNGVQLRRAHSLKDGDQIEVGSSTLEAHGLPSVPLAAELEEVAEQPTGPPAVLAAAAFAPAAVAPAAFPPAAAPGPPPPGFPPAAPRMPPEAEPPPAFPPGGGPPFGPPGIPAAPQAPGPEPAWGPQYVPQGAASARLSSRRGRVIGVFAAVFAIAAIAAVAVVVLVAPLGTRTCPSGFVCQKPPTAPPLQALTTFTGSLGWRVEYDAQNVVPITANAAGNELSLHESTNYDRRALGNSGSPVIAVLIRGYRSAEVSPSAAIQKLADVIKANLVGTVTAPTSDQLFGKPVLGFHPAVGEVIEGNAQTPQGPGPLVKLAIVSAASGGVTVALAVAYPVQQGQNQGSNPDRPLDTFGDEILGTVRFPSDGAA